MIGKLGFNNNKVPNRISPLKLLLSMYGVSKDIHEIVTYYKISILSLVYRISKMFVADQ